jgi:ABC-type multidrug transport system ATPase subunit
VVKEIERVENTPKEKMNVRVDHFNKVYKTMFGTPFQAVEDISFGVDYGECFCLLGVNGAGKTTAFKSLTNDIVPTAGELTINGMSIKNEFNKVRKLIGYCP